MLKLLKADLRVSISKVKAYILLSKGRKDSLVALIDIY
jgi:hypothetical protein